MLILSDPQPFEEKEQLYIAVRKQEGRVYTDEELFNLPGIDKGHQHYGEWVYRKQSFLRFSAYLKKAFKGKLLNILDIGCGNGWMSHSLHKDGHRVMGLDMNITELKQAERVFGNSESLKWVYADVFGPEFSTEQFDVIVLAASCQYFPDLAKLTEHLKTLLHKGGQIHLTDSKFYSGKDCKAAKQRSFDYYTRLGFPEMSVQYHHHTKAAVKSLGYKKLFPRGFVINAKLEWWALNG